MFSIDKQTLSDLHAINWNSFSLLDFFDETLTVGGRNVLHDIFIHPLNDQKEILSRQEAIAYLVGIDIDDFFDKYMMDDLERYLNLSQELYAPNYLYHYLDKFSTNFWSLHYQKERLLIRQSVGEIALILFKLYDFFERALRSGEPIGVFQRLSEAFLAGWEDVDFSLLERISAGNNGMATITEYDYIFRNTKKVEVREAFHIWYMLDAFRSVTKAFQKKPLVFPAFTHEQHTSLVIKGCYNLALENPVKNDIDVEKEQHIWFLTGANMTGKSTLLKSIGACVYLAHLGLPVPAESMQTSLFHGLLTTINLGDDLHAGYSHFFNEVKRLKSIANELGKNARMLVVLDELFKGTNYQDAYEATVELIDSLVGVEDSVFLLSSHITELSSVLKGYSQVDFRYLATQEDAEKGLQFSYRLVSGVADKKIGMWLLKREGVFQAFRDIKKT